MDVRECWSANRDEFPYATLRELIEGELENLKVGQGVWRGSAAYLEPSTLLSADVVARMAVEGAWRELGDAGDGFLDTSTKAKDELQQMLDGWMLKHSKGRRMYQVVSATAYTLRRTDFTAEELEILDEMASLSE